MAEQRPPWMPWAVLFAGVLTASWSAVLTRLASEATPLAISFWRCTAASVLLLPFALRTRSRERGRPGGGAERRAALVAGVFLAVHFAAWITSLELTTIASAVLLVSTSPVFVAVAAWALLDERLARPGWAGIALAVGGAALVTGGDLGGASLRGDALALAGGAAAGGYVLCGSIARRRMGALGYAAVVYGLAGALLLAACVLSGSVLWGWGAPTWWALAGIVLGPQLTGHTAINFVLGEIEATTVAVAIMAEPVIATGLAYLVFREVPSLLVVPGGAAILLGIYLTSTARRSPPEIVE